MGGLEQTRDRKPYAIGLLRPGAQVVNRLALVAVASICCSTPALAVGDPWGSWGPDAAQAWWLFGGIGALVLGAAWAMSIVLKRPRGARFWEAVVVIALLGLAVAAWFVVWLFIVF